MTRRKRAIVALGTIGLAALAVSAAVVGPPRVRRNSTAARQMRAWWLGAQYAGDAGVIFQPRHFDCGAAALQMVLASNGIQRPIDDLERELETTQNGTTMLHLRTVATRTGLHARSWHLTPDALIHAPLPAIAYMDGSHFVVVQRLVSPTVLDVADPALGRLRWPMEGFRKHWRGETLIFNAAWSPPFGS